MMYFFVEEYNKQFNVRMTDKFYELMYPYYEGNSYLNIFYRLFGLTPQNFYHYIGATYNAYFEKGFIPGFVKFFFKTKDDARKFCDEANKRLAYVANHISNQGG